MAELRKFSGMFAGWRCQSFIWLILIQLVSGIRENNSEVLGFATEEAFVMDYEHQTNCTPPAVDDFPSDGLDVDERIKGWIVFHLLILFYVTGALAIVCDNYFVPVMQEFSQSLKLPSDIAGATFMALGTSCPELFVALIGAFITEGDIGVGAVIGSAVFNVLAIVSVCGICAGTVVAVNWRPLTRDCIVYLIAVASLFIVIRDGKVCWYEGCILVGEYFAYILILYLNARFQDYCRGSKTDYDIPSVEKDIYKQSDTDSYCTVSTISQEFSDMQIYSTKVDMDQLKSAAEIVVGIVIPPSEMKEITEASKQEKLSVSSNDTEKSSSAIWNFPYDEGRFTKIMWVLWWPVRFLFHLTIPSIKEDHFSILTIITFVMSVAYIAALAYLATWMVSIIGYTIHVPDSVMGLTFIALGNSLPEIISSIIVSRQSLGNMALSNAMGGNLFALLMCLGAPWIAKSSISTSGYVRIYSAGLTYSVLTLFLAVVLMFIVIAAYRFRLNKKVGVICLLLYITYVTFSCMHEMNYFGEINLPICQSVVS